MTSPPSQPSLAVRLAIAALLVAIVAAVYGQTVGFGYVEFDDPLYARDNQRVRAGLAGESIAWAFKTSHAANWHPLTWLSLMLDVELYGTPPDDRPGGMHLTNLTLHASNAVLLMIVFSAMTGAFWRSAFVAALFAAHPMHVESVAWISERKDVLSAFFWLLTMLAYLHYVRRGGARRYVLVVLAMALGLMCKPMLVTLPFALLLLDWWPLRRCRFVVRGSSFVDRIATTNNEQRTTERTLKLIAEKLPLIALAVVSAIITWRVQLMQGPIEDGVAIPLATRAGNAIVSYVLYLGKLFWPANLAALYPNPAQIGREFWTAWQALAAAALLIAITVTCLIQAKWRPWLLVGWLWFLGTLVPVIGLVQIGRHAMADRYAYIPFIGLYLIVSWGGAELLQRLRVPRLAAAAGAGAIVLALAMAAHHQVGFWRDSETLFSRAIGVTDDNWLMHNNLAAVLERDGRTGEAIAQVQVALALHPDCYWLHEHLGDLFHQEDRLFEAQAAFARAVELKPDNAEANHHLGVVISKRGRLNEALEWLERAAVLDPRDATIQRDLAITLLNAGRFPEALRAVEAAIDLAPQDNRYRELRTAILERRAVELYQPGETKPEGD